MAVGLIFYPTECAALIERTIDDRFHPLSDQTAEDLQPACAKVDLNGRLLRCNPEEHTRQQQEQQDAAFGFDRIRANRDDSSSDEEGWKKPDCRRAIRLKHHDGVR